MTFTVSDAAVEALKPTRLPDDASLVKYEDGRITWTSEAQSGGEGIRSIQTEEIVLIGEVSAGIYLVLVLSPAEEGAAAAEPPFQLSSFTARSLPQHLLDGFLVKEIPEYLSASTESPLDVIVSSKSGTGLSQKFYDAVLQPLLGTLGLAGDGAPAAAESPTSGKSYRVTVTKDAESVKDFSRERWGRDGRSVAQAGSLSGTVVLLSGDGGVVDLLNGITQPVESSQLPTIALIPLGTGNALFHSLHKPHYTASGQQSAPSHLVLALRALLKGKAAPLPTFEALFPPGSHLVEEKNMETTGTSEPVSQLTGAIVASYGFHSQLVWESDTPSYRKHGEKRFGMVAQELLKEGHAYDASVETPSSALGTARFNYILATMVSNLEKTFTISPDSRPFDGHLRLVHFGDVGGQKTMEIMAAAYNNGAHVGIEGVGYEAVDYVKVTTHEEDARWRKVCIDGTIVEIPRGGTMTVKKSPEARIRVLVLGA
ncbi:diacylglycerol kinase catalytic domain-containing protein [Diaporthe helianthi]|uniref:Diacylglycerol kinase catalytic domain-containing protein n=1 Tax=Diaporthe helianthi TaxID=158607 RepID=A0A2P5HSN9_DIAHE|nr:diacylglycerol kinase catalytic domain-containing protein [Diaporthe helianthi]